MQQEVTEPAPVPSCVPPLPGKEAARAGAGEPLAWSLDKALALAGSPVVRALWVRVPVKGMRPGCRSLPARGLGLTPRVVHVRDTQMFLSPRLLLPSLPLSLKRQWEKCPLVRMHQGEKRRKGLLASCSGQKAYSVTASSFRLVSGGARGAATIVPPERSAVPPERSAVLPEQSAVLPERSAVPPERSERSAVSPEQRGTSSEGPPSRDHREESPPALTTCPQPGLPGSGRSSGHTEQGRALLLWDPHPGPIQRTRGHPLRRFHNTTGWNRPATPREQGDRRRRSGSRRKETEETGPVSPRGSEPGGCWGRTGLPRISLGQPVSSERRPWV